MKTKDLRKNFLSFFQNKGHSLLPSGPVIPHNDPSLLFVNAGMNQFKDIFLGFQEPPCKRAVTTQKCIRAGGKHNDLENVGHTTRHLTFFEMLGNFSFNDYFKEEAIEFAWLLAIEGFQFDKERIYPTVFRDDDEAFQIWTKYVPESRISRMGEKDNFWSMGDSGPCGPCSELLFDRGAEFGQAASPLEDSSGERFIEFWNLVFMQHNREKDGTLQPLQNPSIDTGAGLERVALLSQNVSSVFEIDIFQSLIRSIEDKVKVRYDKNDPQQSAAFHVIADHLRSLSFAIGDGAQPSNTERGYVLRKIVRRAVRYGRTLGFQEPFLFDLLPPLISEMGEEFPELISSKKLIQETLFREEESFFKTLKRGGNIFSQTVEKAQKEGVFSGGDAFKLKDTYGFPLEEIILLAKDSNLSLNLDEYYQLEREAKEKSKKTQKNSSNDAEKALFASFIQQHGPSDFVRTESGTATGKVIGIIHEKQTVDSLEAGKEALIILDKTPFYPEMGGQSGDKGALSSDNTFFDVYDCRTPYKGLIAHSGKVSKGTIRVGDTLEAAIDKERRRKISINHTATHLLHWALHKTLGEHARQAGSLVEENKLRFDFAHFEQLSDETLREIERLVNGMIRKNISVATKEMALDEVSERTDIKQLFGEKYDSPVRVVSIDDAKELCGGTHIESTGAIGYFRIARESSIASGIRRIEALTGKEAEDFAYQSDDLLKEATSLLKTPRNKFLPSIEKLQKEHKELEKEIKQRQKEHLKRLSDTFTLKNSSQGFSYTIHSVVLPFTLLKEFSDLLASIFPYSLIVIGCKDQDKVAISVKVSPDLVKKGLNANTLLQIGLQKVDGKGGGRDTFAQGRGTYVSGLEDALQAIEDMLK